MVRELMDVLVWGFSFFLMADLLRRALLTKGKAPEFPPGTAPRHRAMLDIADQLEEQRRFGEAALLYERVLTHQAQEPRALHGLARCAMEQSEPARALELYEKLMSIDPRYRKYAAALEYAEALHAADRTTEAVELLDGMVQETGRLNHSLALAHFLDLAGQPGRARVVLEEALQKFAGAPESEQEADRRWQRRVEEKLNELDETSSARGV